MPFYQYKKSLWGSDGPKSCHYNMIRHDGKTLLYPQGDFIYWWDGTFILKLAYIHVAFLFSPAISQPWCTTRKQLYDTFEAIYFENTISVSRSHWLEYKRCSTPPLCGFSIRYVNDNYRRGTFPLIQSYHDLPYRCLGIWKIPKCFASSHKCVEYVYVRSFS